MCLFVGLLCAFCGLGLAASDASLMCGGLDLTRDSLRDALAWVFPGPQKMIYE